MCGTGDSPVEVACVVKRFVFRLETVRRLRKQAEDAQKRVVAEHTRRLTREQQRIQRLRAGLDAQRRAARADHGVALLDLASFRCRYFYMARLDREVMESRQRAGKMSRALDQERKKLGELSARRKVIDRLRDKQWMRHRIAVRRAEQAEDDENATQKYIRERTSFAGVRA